MVFLFHSIVQLQGKKEEKLWGWEGAGSTALLFIA